MATIPTPPTAGIPVEAMSVGGAPMAYTKPDIKSINPAEMAKTAKVVEKKSAPAAEKKPAPKVIEKEEPAQPVNLEALNPPEEVNKALEEAAKLLLELKDANILLVALARQAEHTPMGNEFRYAVLDGLKHLNPDDIPEAQKLGFASMQGHLDAMKLPDKTPTASFNAFLMDNKDKFPPEADPVRLALMLDTGNMTIGSVVDMIQKFPKFKALQEPMTRAMLGDIRPPTGANSILEAVHIDTSKENLAIMKGILQSETPVKGRRVGFNKERAFGILLIIMSLSTMMQQLAQEDRKQGHG